MGKARNSIIISGIIAAFILGSVSSVTLAQGSPASDAALIAALNEIRDAILGITPTQTVTVQSLEGPIGPEGPAGPPGPSGSEMPISLGEVNIFRFFEICQNSGDPRFQVSGGLVLLSDGTVKIPLATGGFTTPNPIFGSLPAGVWHDIEGNYNENDVQEDCFFSGSGAEQSTFFRACAVAENGDVYCVDAQITDGVVTGDLPVWTFQGNALP